ncbi:unnamed protein product [Urochloa humidicola]
METLTNQRAPSESPATRPRWLMLDPGVNEDNSDPSAADTKTKAASCTSTGQSFTVSFNLAAPPATSRFYCDWIGGAPGDGSARDSDNDVTPH